MPPPPSWGEGHTCWRERGWESPNSDEGTYTVVLFIYTLIVGRMIGLHANPPPSQSRQHVALLSHQLWLLTGWRGAVSYHRKKAWAPIIAIYGPMIYTVRYVMLLMRVDTLRGKVGGGWALEIETFLDPVKWHRALRQVAFGAQKSLSIRGP